MAQEQNKTNKQQQQKETALHTDAAALVAVSYTQDPDSVYCNNDAGHMYQHRHKYIHVCIQIYSFCFTLAVLGKLRKVGVESLSSLGRIGYTNKHFLGVHRCSGPARAAS